MHWLKINKRIEYKLLSLIYKVLTTRQPDYLHKDLCSVYMQNPLLICCHLSSTICIFLITNHQPLFHICITPVESALFFIPSTSFCSLSSWFTSSCAYHLITVRVARCPGFDSPVFCDLSGKKYYAKPDNLVWSGFWPTLKTAQNLVS